MVRSLTACCILFTCPTLVTPSSFKSRRPKVRSSRPRMSWRVKLSAYSDNWIVSSHAATSATPHVATTCAALLLPPPPPRRNLCQNSPRARPFRSLHPYIRKKILTFWTVGLFVGGGRDGWQYFHLLNKHIKLFKINQLTYSWSGKILEYYKQSSWCDVGIWLFAITLLLKNTHDVSGTGSTSVISWQYKNYET